jgi:hypothetical protein
LTPVKLQPPNPDDMCQNLARLLTIGAPETVELRNLYDIERATRSGRPEMPRFGIALTFVFAILRAAGMRPGDMPQRCKLSATAVIVGHMAIDTNDLRGAPIRREAEMLA